MSLVWHTPAAGRLWLSSMSTWCMGIQDPLVSVPHFTKSSGRWLWLDTPVVGCCCLWSLCDWLRTISMNLTITSRTDDSGREDTIWQCSHYNSDLEDSRSGDAIGCRSDSDETKRWCSQCWRDLLWGCDWKILGVVTRLVVDLTVMISSHRDVAIGCGVVIWKSRSGDAIGCQSDSVGMNGRSLECKEWLNDSDSDNMNGSSSWKSACMILTLMIRIDDPHSVVAIGRFWLWWYEWMILTVNQWLGEFDIDDTNKWSSQGRSVIEWFW